MSDNFLNTAPWHVSERGNGSCFSVAHHVQTKGNRLSEHYICHVCDGAKDARSKADFLSSAPEMYDALMGCIGALAAGDAATREQQQDAMKAAFAAIKKARGES